ncbi:MAG TPA: hypothetical protein VFJ16_22070, partial [Longimicrobium sp.]|nr:hypothetical protein [Longimicrobium sp.]
AGAGDGAAPTPFSDLIREEDLLCLPTALGYRVVTEPRLGIVRVDEPAAGRGAEPLLEVAAD